MSIYRLIAPQWLMEDQPNIKKVIEGEFNEAEIQEFNSRGYNIYFLPNYPSIFDSSHPTDGASIDTFRFAFVDLDMKDGVYGSKEEFIKVLESEPLLPSFIVDSGNGIHAYWQIDGLDAISYLKIQRRLIRKFNTDETVGQIFQLMRVPNTLNTKVKGHFKPCELLRYTYNTYTSEEVNNWLPIITPEDEKYCLRHYNKTYKIEDKSIKINEKIPLKFASLISSNNEVKAIWSGGLDDRSKGDYRLGHIMFANGFKREEALSVLINSAKALSRAPVHRVSYATNIVDQIWTFEESNDKEGLNLSNSVKDILNRPIEALEGTRFPCHRYIDATSHGFRLGQVIGLVAGSGVGKTAVALNMFMGFVQNNPDHDHFFIPLEQPANEIAQRWKDMCGNKEHLYEKVQVLSNYEDNGQFRHLSFTEIRDYILKYQKVTGRKVGCVVIDHIGALKKKGKEGENQDLMDICHSMKAFAVETNTLLVMQSQAPRQKAGIGDLELDKDAAYGTVYFESYCDYLISIWQPLKRCYSENGCPTVTAFKFCKIRHKKVGVDEINEDVCYYLYFEPHTSQLRELTQNEEKSFTYFNNRATNKRKSDKKTDITQYQSITWTGDKNVGTTDNSKDLSTITAATKLYQ